MNPRVIHAIAKTNATCDSAECRDSVGTAITQSDIKALTGRLLHQTREAEQFMNRARELIKDFKQDLTVEIGDYDVNIARVASPR